MNLHEVFIHIHQGCFAGTGAIVRLPQCQWSKPDGYGKISQCITTTKHSKAKTVCIFLGIYCTFQWHEFEIYQFKITCSSPRGQWVDTETSHSWPSQWCHHPKTVLVTVRFYESILIPWQSRHSNNPFHWHHFCITIQISFCCVPKWSGLYKIGQQQCCGMC